MLILHVSEVERYLQQPTHLCFVEEIEYRVDEYIASCGPSGAESYPLPVVILSVQDKVHSHYRSAHRHHAQYRIHKKHEPIDVVKFVRPECGEYEVHFDENGPKGKNASGWNDEIWVSIPCS